MTFYPKPRNWNTHPEPPKIACPELAQRLKTEDKAFDKQWKSYWRNRSKWASFEDYLKSAA